MMVLREVPAPLVTLTLCPDARAFVTPRFSVLLSRDDGYLHLSISSPFDGVTDAEAKSVIAQLAPRVPLVEETGFDGGRTRHFWEAS